MNEWLGNERQVQERASLMTSLNAMVNNLTCETDEENIYELQDNAMK